MTARWPRALVTPAGVELVAALLALGAAAVLVWPVSVAVPAASRAMPRPPARPPAIVAVDSTTGAIVATNLFSGSRRAPRERFRLPGTEPVAEVPGASLTAGAPDTDAGPQLVGVVLGPGVSRALVQLASDSTPRLLVVGDRIGRWQLRRIGSDRVELSSASGTRTVRLSRRSPSDSAGSRP